MKLRTSLQNHLKQRQKKHRLYWRVRMAFNHTLPNVAVLCAVSEEVKRNTERKKGKSRVADSVIWLLFRINSLEDLSDDRYQIG